MRRLESHWGTEEFWADGSYVSPHVSGDPGRVRAWARYARLSASRGAALALGRMQAQADIRAVLPTVMVPTLVLHRIDDTAEPVGQARYIGEQVPNAEVVELPGNEHAPFAGDSGARSPGAPTFCLGRSRRRSAARENARHGPVHGSRRLNGASGGTR